jgi:putative ATP-dependent endonuclease of OLD family
MNLLPWEEEIQPNQPLTSMETSPIRVEKVRIHQFRSLKDVETTLSGRTLLIGANNAGKTSFLRALSLALGEGRKLLSRDDLFIDGQGNGPEDGKLWVDVMVKPLGESEFSTDWVLTFGNEIKSASTGEDFFAFRTLVEFTRDQSQALIQRYVITDWESGNVDESEGNKVTADLSKLPLFFIDAQRDLEADLRYAQSYFGRLASQIEYDGAQKQALEDALDELNHQAVGSSPVLAHLKTTLEELNRTVNTSHRGQGVEITPFPKKLRDLHKGLKVNFQDGGSDTFSLEYHGMGTRSWASLLGYKAFVNWMHQKAQDDQDVLHPLLALEEPEAHLHPNAQRQVYGQLKDVVGQKIISTHSPYIAPLGRLEELRVFYKQGDVTKVRDLSGLVGRLTPKERYMLESELIRQRGELLFARFVVLFEGQTEEEALPIFAKHYWGCEAFEKGVALMYCAGDAYKLYLLFLEELGLPWIVFSDYDKPGVISKAQQAANEVGIEDIEADDRFILLNQSVEDYLIDAGYRNEFQNAYFEIKGPEYSDPIKRANEQSRVEGLSDEEIKTDKPVLKWKRKMAPLWATAITQHPDPTKRLPPQIKALFEAIDARIS